jgi:hypothetical protein
MAESALNDAATLVGVQQRDLDAPNRAAYNSRCQEHKEMSDMVSRPSEWVLSNIAVWSKRFLVRVIQCCRTELIDMDRHRNNY